jgi:hypothetical protein
MLGSLKIGWIATDIGERIESSTTYIVDSLILMSIHIKTHDTIYIFSQIYSLVTHNKYGILLDKKGNDFINKLDFRLKFDEKNWLKKIIKIPMDITTVASIDEFFTSELDDFRNEWLEGYVELRKKDPNANAGSYTLDRIENYLKELGNDLPDDFYELKSHFVKLDEITKE